ncbi:MAG: hypothetical protein FJX22_00110, partial [Alphaproteobacteria bacterium]|nr:hypothetical protein [Alphaproteobacteria bacterium]
MAKNQQVGLETVNAYGAEGLPASFELSVNRGDTVVRVGFNIRSINGQNLYVSDMVNSADVDLVEN